VRGPGGVRWGPWRLREARRTVAGDRSWRGGLPEAAGTAPDIPERVIFYFPGCICQHGTLPILCLLLPNILTHILEKFAAGDTPRLWMMKRAI
jgi:hypothetical protein